MEAHQIYIIIVPPPYRGVKRCTMSVCPFLCQSVCPVPTSNSGTSQSSVINERIFARSSNVMVLLPCAKSLKQLNEQTLRL